MTHMTSHLSMMPGPLQMSPVLEARQISRLECLDNTIQENQHGRQITASRRLLLLPLGT